MKKQVETGIVIVCAVLVLGLAYVNLTPEGSWFPGRKAKVETVDAVVELARDYAKLCEEKAALELRVGQMEMGILKEDDQNKAQVAKYAGQTKLVLKLLQEVLPLVPKRQQKKLQEIFTKYKIPLKKVEK